MTNFKRIGAPGVAIFGGFIQSDETDKRLVGRERYRLYSEILANTPIIAAGVRFFSNLVSKAGWSVEPAEESAEAENVAERVSAATLTATETPWHRVVRRAAMYRFYGYSLQEWTARRMDDGSIGFLDIEPRAQLTIERWFRDLNGKIEAVEQRHPETQQLITLPREKLVYMLDDSLHDSPEGLGLFRHLAHTAKRLSRYELLEGWSFETDLRGMPVGRAPLTELARMVETGEISAEIAETLRKPIEDWVKGHIKTPTMGLMLDSAVYESSGESRSLSNVHQFSAELLRGDPTGQKEIADAITRMQHELARVMGVEQLLLGSDSAGSFALSKDKTQSFGLIVDNTLQEIRETFERDLLLPLFQMNGWDLSLMPTFKTEKIQYRDVEQVTTALSEMAAAGSPLALDDEAVNEVRDLLGLPHAPEAMVQDQDVVIPNIELEEEEDV